MGHAIRHAQSAAELRQRAAGFRRLASFYAGDVAAIIMAVADDLEVAADALPGGDAIRSRLRPPSASNDTQLDETPAQSERSTQHHRHGPANGPLALRGSRTA